MEKVNVEIECAIEEGAVSQIFLMFTDDRTNWYEVEMKPSQNGYSIDIPNINEGTKLIYCFRAIDLDGEEFVEDNEGNYYSKIAENEEIEPIDEPLSDFDDDLDSSGDSVADHMDDGHLEYVAKSESSPFGNWVLPSSKTEEKTPEKTPERTQVISPKKPSTAPKKPSPLKPQSKAKIPQKPKTQAIKKVVNVSTINPDLPQPIVAFNPYPPEMGEIDPLSQQMQSFSQIDSFQRVKNPKQVTGSSDKKFSPQRIIQCPNIKCKGVNSKNWVFCSFCGHKL